MLIKWLVVGPLETNCYIVGCERTGLCAVIDPGGDGERILRTIRSEGWELLYIINTHGHFDHTAENAYLKARTPCELLIHRADAPLLLQGSRNAAFWGFSIPESPLPDRFLEEGDVIVIGNLSLRVIHTPGHTPGGISLFSDGVVFVGDTLFAGSIGRTDFPGGDYYQLIRSVKEKLFVLGDEVVVYPGHGPKTTIGRERRTNPFFTEEGWSLI